MTRKGKRPAAGAWGGPRIAGPGKFIGRPPSANGPLVSWTIKVPPELRAAYELLALAPEAPRDAEGRAIGAAGIARGALAEWLGKKGAGK